MKRVTKRWRAPFNGKAVGGQQKCLCIQSVSSSICCLGSTKQRRKKRCSALQCTAIQISAVQRAKAETGSVWPLLLLASSSAQRGKANAAVLGPPSILAYVPLI